MRARVIYVRVHVRLCAQHPQRFLREKSRADQLRSDIGVGEYVGKRGTTVGGGGGERRAMGASAVVDFLQTVARHVACTCVPVPVCLFGSDARRRRRGR